MCDQGAILSLPPSAALLLLSGAPTQGRLCSGVWESAQLALRSVLFLINTSGFYPRRSSGLSHFHPAARPVK